MMKAKELREFLDSLPDDANVAVDDGGLQIVEIDDEGVETGSYIEVGGIPLEDEDEDES